MKLLDLTLDTPAENVALDEALLEEAERSNQPTEILRLWEPHQLMAVVGRSSRVSMEVRVDVCQERRVPILRRSSGGAAIVTGPGCLMYAVVLSYQRRGALRVIERAHRFVLDTHARALAPLVPGVERAGISDLALSGGQRKFSGNSLRCRRRHLLYHGTLLYDFPLDLIGACLGTPPRQPDYRQGRDHAGFLTNLPAMAAALRRALTEAWDATEETTDWPAELAEQLVGEKYSQRKWNFRH